MSIEAMKQALEALDNLARYADTCELFLKETHPGKADALRERVTKSIEAITSLRQAIEQAEKPNIKQVIYLYDKPPAAQRQWVGLTEAEINEWDYDTRDVVMDIEKLLREKNT